MGNAHCPPIYIEHLATIAQNICPFPNYDLNPHLISVLSRPSPSYLSEHCMTVQRSLTPRQLEDFNKSLNATFGRERKVKFGASGLVALSLAVLFETLAKQARGEMVVESVPIQGLFVKDPRGFYPPGVFTMSKCLRLIPYIANNPTKMIVETER